MPLSINPYKTKLNHGNAYWMARLSKMVYTEKQDNSPDEDKILKELKGEDPGFNEVVPFSVGNTQAMFVDHKQYFCIAFRGTEERGDWRDNFNADKFKLPRHGYEVHEGFFNQFSNVWEQIEKTHSERREKDPRPLFFTGHSLGGGIATVATAMWVLDGDRQFTSTYTFGQPRAVTIETARILAPMFGSRFFRFHNNNDIVPRVPPRFMEFSHVGQIVYIDTDKEMHLDPGFWFRFQDKFRGAWDAWKEPGTDIFADHDMEDYLYAVKNWDMRD